MPGSAALLIDESYNANPASMRATLAQLGRTEALGEIAIAAANRKRAELEGLIGFFINTLALRTNLAGDPTVKELLARVRDMTLTAYEYREMPYEKLVEELQPRG